MGTHLTQNPRHPINCGTLGESLLENLQQYFVGKVVGSDESLHLLAMPKQPRQRVLQVRDMKTDGGNFVLLANYHPQHPFPELLCSSAGPPSDAQATVLWEEVEGTKQAISIAETHIDRIQNAVELLLRYQQKLQTLAATHRGVLSALRRLPNEILLHIFDYSVNPAAQDPFSRAPWVVTQVCSHWRTVVVTAPTLWRHVFCSWEVNQHSAFATNMLPLQLERVRGVPVSMHFGWKPLQPVLDLCLRLSSQWEDALFTVQDFMSPPLSDQTFPALKRLTLMCRELGPWPHTRMAGLLPHPEHLIFNQFNWGLPQGLLIPWSQLKKCDLTGLNAVDFFRILGQLRDADVSVARGHRHGNPRGPTSDVPPPPSLIRSLTITDSNQLFLGDVFADLSTPTLETLTMKDNIRGSSHLVERIVGLLGRSACNLQRLSLDTALQEDEMLALLESPYIRNIRHLDLPETGLSPAVILAVTSPLVNFRRLTFHRDSVGKDSLMAAIAARNHPDSEGSPQGQLQVIFA
ncbi:hypothetical protein C8R46DRAFT_1350871 [Mycena filopes]|nr:hypothetical protein C8R46DRAFT_1350871 [Mycena filopes]